MTDCKLCQQEIEGPRLGCSLGTICMKCSADITLAEYQPIASYNRILWCLSETFFRRGKGEDVTFESVWTENYNDLKLVKFEELFNLK